MSPTSTSSSEPSSRRKARRLGLRMLLFAVPLFMGLLLMEGALWRSGESWGIERVLFAQQANPEALYGTRLLSQQINRYKVAAMEQRQPELIALGTSRVLQIRENMFPGLHFYNAGSLLQSRSDLEQFVDRVEDGHIPRPRAVLVALEPTWMMPSAPAGVGWLRPRDLDSDDRRWRKRVRTWNQVLHKRPSSLLRRALTPAAHGGQPAIGLLALEEGGGFRADGSRQYSQRLLEEFRNDSRYQDRESPPIIQRIVDGAPMFAPGGRIDPALMARVADTLARLRSGGTEVLAFLPPFASPCAERLEQDPRYLWWADYHQQVPAALEARGIPCVALRTPRDLGLDDRVMWDGLHASDVAMAHLVLRLLEKAAPESLLRQVDPAALQQRLDDPATLPLQLARP